MNKGYIKVVLALLSVTGYMQNIAFASEYDSSANSSNEECKQQLSIHHEEVKEQSDSTSEEAKEQSDSTPEEVKEQLSSILEEVKDQLASTPEEVKEQLASTPKPVKQQISSTPQKTKASFRSKTGKQQLSPTPKTIKQQLPSAPKTIKQQLPSAPKTVKQQLPSAPKTIKQELSPTPKTVKQQLSSNPNTIKRQLPSAPKTVKQELSSNPNTIKQQLPSAPNTIKQQLYPTPNIIKQQLYPTPNIIKQQLSSVLNKAKQQGYFIPITFKEKDKFDPVEYKRQLSLKAKEGKHAEHVMADALNIAKEHAKSTKDYKLYSKKYKGESLYFKNVNNAEIGMLEFTIPNADHYDDIVKMLWDPNGEKKFNRVFVEGSFSRVYNKQLAIIQQRYLGLVWDRYYHALASTYQLSKDETAIVLTSSDMDDNNYDDVKYVNPIVKSANTFNPIIESEDIRNLTKMHANLVAFFIKKEENDVKITHLCSMNYDFSSGDKQQRLRELIANKMFSAVNLRDVINKE